MELRSILVHLDLQEQAPARIAAAAALARRHKAHLIGLAPTGWVRMPVDYTGAVGREDYLEAMTSFLREQADQAVLRFEAQVASLGLTSYESRVEIEDIVPAMTLASRYCDLTVVTQSGPGRWTAPQQAGMPESVLLHSGRPMLVMPHAAATSAVVPPDGRVLLAWDGGREASRAALDALPLLREAKEVEVMIFVPLLDSFDPLHGPLPGADICKWLAQHGLNVRATRAEIEIPVGEALLSHAADVDAQLIVAGGYGHSRLRETVLGGVTRTLLRHSPVPLLLSH